MSIRASHLRELVILPVLDRLDKIRPGLGGQAAMELLIGTAAQESEMGRSLRQHPTGPARGIYQIEPATFTDLQRWLQTRQDLLAGMVEWASPVIPLGPQIAGNLFFATAIARLNYWRKPGPLPAADDLAGLARYWKQWWNTPLGAGTVEQFTANYRKFSKT